MKDGLGQDIEIGAKVAWVSGKGNYAGVIVYEVEKITEKRVKLMQVKHWAGPGGHTYVAPTDLVVIDRLLNEGVEDDE